MNLFDSLSRNTKSFYPEGPSVTMYVCGLTPYAPSHLGHAMRAVVFDTLRRYLEYTGYDVNHVENFTDIDDKMIDVASREGISTQELAERNIKLYLKEMDDLNVLRATVYPRATGEIASMIEMIQGLEKKGFAYSVKGDVYFSVRKCEEYGKLSRRDLDTMIAGARVDADENKIDPMDFSLWKSKKPGEPSWDSPWGPGRPGWHIECSSMALRYLGVTMDIHGGGHDLVFPHHENEIAQTENYTGTKPMARFWVHNGWMKLGDEKMSKSTGNFITLHDALERFSPDALRLFFLTSHYRSPITYSAESVMSQERAVTRLRNALYLKSEVNQNDNAIQVNQYRDRFRTSMDDDLNTPRAIAILFDLARDINKSSESGTETSKAQMVLSELAGVLGLTLDEPSKGVEQDTVALITLVKTTYHEVQSAGEEDIAYRMKVLLQEQGIQITGPVSSMDPSILDQSSDHVVERLMESLINSRTELRESKRFDLSDSIRDRLSNQGYLLEDSKAGTEWKRNIY